MEEEAARGAAQVPNGAHMAAAQGGDGHSVASSYEHAAVENEDFPVSGPVGPANFAKLRKLGRGAMGQVFLVMLRDSSPLRLYAMKVISREEMLSKNRAKRVMTEREIFATAKHPFIVTMYASFQTRAHLYLVMEYCEGGEFFRILQKQPRCRLREEAVRFYTAEVILALEYLHSLGFIYRDLKPENIMMRLNRHLALTDFDLSAMCAPVNPVVIARHQKLAERLKGVVHPQKKSPSKLDVMTIVDSEPEMLVKHTSFVGTPEYLAPEVISGNPQTGSVDWWTVGILVYEMLVGMTPFKAHAKHGFHLPQMRGTLGLHTDSVEDNGLFRNVLHDVVHFPPDVRVSKEARDFVCHLLSKDPSKRLGHEHGASDLKAHRWFDGFNFALIRNEVPPIKPVLGHNPLDLSQYDPQSIESDEEPVGHGVIATELQSGWRALSTTTSASLEEAPSPHSVASSEKTNSELMDKLDRLAPL
mmetsp:Transcript_5409/g.14516  ORF Transcript_5409/g.14516 Transcript_5409/m.14516 type:complete len:473 (+) Transcript_5409:29-1447(+)